jgi:hypothetical protein
MPVDEEKRRVGREVKKYLVSNRQSREQFCFETKLGKSTVDKLITGIYSDATLQIVLERTKFVRNNAFASKRLGGMLDQLGLDTWEIIFLQPSISGDDDLVAFRVAIEWDDNLPGLALIQKSGKSSERNCIGALWIPHERSPLIYIQPVDMVGRMLIVSTMLGEPSMRGLMLTVNNLVANAYVPVAVPILLRRLEEGEEITPGELGTINSLNPKFASYQSELKRILGRRFGRLISPHLPPTA